MQQNLVGVHKRQRHFVHRESSTTKSESMVQKLAADESISSLALALDVIVSHSPTATCTLCINPEPAAPRPATS